MRRQPPDAFRSPLASDDRRRSDPLRLCVATTVALIAWVVTPPAAAALFSGLALVTYTRAHRRGLRKSRCILGDARLVMAYLVVVFALGTAVTVRDLWRALG